LVNKMMKVDFAFSAGPDKAFIISAANILQALVCLSDLIRATADDADKVRVYAKLAEEKLQALGELMRPLLWNPT
jgi:site-specific recombinase